MSNPSRVVSPSPSVCVPGDVFFVAALKETESRPSVDGER